MERKEIERIVEQSSNKLFQISSPPVRYWLLTQVMGKDEHDAVLKETLRQCQTSDDPRMEKTISWLANARSADGFWNQSMRPHPERDQRISLIATRTLARYARTQ